MKLYLISAHCGDYYCEGEHVLGVATSPEEAEKLRAEADALMVHVEPKNGHAGHSYKKWESVYADPTEIEANALRKDA